MTLACLFGSGGVRRGNKKGTRFTAEFTRGQMGTICNKTSTPLPRLFKYTWYSKKRVLYFRVAMTGLGYLWHGFPTPGLWILLAHASLLVSVQGGRYCTTMQRSIIRSREVKWPVQSHLYGRSLSVESIGLIIKIVVLCVSQMLLICIFSPRIFGTNLNESQYDWSVGRWHETQDVKNLVPGLMKDSVSSSLVLGFRGTDSSRMLSSACSRGLELEDGLS